MPHLLQLLCQSRWPGGHANEDHDFAVEAFQLALKPRGSCIPQMENLKKKPREIISKSE